MQITDYLKMQGVKVYLKGQSKKEVVKELLDLTSKVYPDLNKEANFKNLLERENIETTAIGDGVAIPHARIEGIDDIYVVFGLLKEGVDFKAIDGQSVRIVFLILSPQKDTSLQLRFLARVSRLMHVEELRKDLLQCRSAGEVLETFKRYEEKHFH